MNKVYRLQRRAGARSSTSKKCREPTSPLNTGTSSDSDTTNPMNQEMGLEAVRFEKPPIHKLREQGLLPVDMHFHTNHSDSPTSVLEAIKLAGKSGVGIAITDHNTISGSLEACKISREVPIIPGLEVSAADGPHILIYFRSTGDMKHFYQRHVEGEKRKSPYLAIYLKTEDIVERARDYNSVVVAAHPYGYLLFNKGLQKCIDADWLPQDLIHDFDGIEVISGGMRREQNIKAAKLAQQYRKAITGGTDGHLLWDLGNVVTCSPSHTVDGFLEDIIKGRNLVVGMEKNVAAKGLMGTVVMTKYLRYTIPSLRVHFEQNMPRITRSIKRATGRKDRSKNIRE